MKNARFVQSIASIADRFSAGFRPMPLIQIPMEQFDSGAMVAHSPAAISRSNRSGVAAVKRAAKKRKAIIRARRLGHS